MLTLIKIYISIECDTHRHITKDNPINFTHNQISYCGYRKNGFIQIDKNISK